MYNGLYMHVICKAFLKSSPTFKIKNNRSGEMDLLYAAGYVSRYVSLHNCDSELLCSYIRGGGIGATGAAMAAPLFAMNCSHTSEPRPINWFSLTRSASDLFVAGQLARSTLAPRCSDTAVSLQHSALYQLRTVYFASECVKNTLRWL